MTYEWEIDGNRACGPLIVCISGSWKGYGSFCLPIRTAKQIVSLCESNIFVVAIPTITEIRSNRGRYLIIDELFDGLAPIQDRLLWVNTYRSQTALEAIERLKYASDVVGSNRRLLVKLEVFDDHLRPVVSETIKACEMIRKRFDCGLIPIISNDLNVAKEIMQIGIEGLRILTGEIGKGTGLEDPDSFREICAYFESENIPIISEGGMSQPAHISAAFECGATAVLCNSCFRNSDRPVDLLKQLLDSAYTAIVSRPKCASINE